LPFSDYGDPLNLYQQLGAGETGDGDQCARRKIVPEDLLAQLGEPIAISRVGDKNRHCHHIRQSAAGLLEGPAEPGKYLVDLGLKIAGERSAGGVCRGDLARQPNSLSTFRDDRLRIGTCLRGFPLL
jgi:hypothetical protein